MLRKIHPYQSFRSLLEAIIARLKNRRFVPISAGQVTRALSASFLNSSRSKRKTYIRVFLN